MKPNTAKSKGRETENEYVEFVSAITGLPLERRRLQGVLDKGDIAGFPNLTVEVKSGGGTLKIPEWMRQLEVERHNAGDPMGQLVIRPRGLPRAGDWWALRPLPWDLELLRQAGYWTREEPF